MRNGGTDMEERIVVTGGRPLNGSVKIPAAEKISVRRFLRHRCSARERCGSQAVPGLADVEHCMALFAGCGLCRPVGGQ